MSVKIKDLPVLERPREKLISNGVKTLSNEELLAIILKTGTKNESAKTLASMILSKIPSISELGNITYKDLVTIKGIGSSKASYLLAAIELSKRINDIPNLSNIRFKSPDIIFKYYKMKLRDEKQENFYAIYLDATKKILGEKLLFIGTVNQSLVHPRNVFKEAYLLDATGIICVHNHPSGEVIPSLEDKNITQKLINIGELFGIKIFDHIIIGRNKYYSFYENGDIL